MLKSKNFKRLPKNVTPVHYSLELIPNIEEFKFKGKAAITIQVTESTSLIVLNALEIRISEIFLVSLDASANETRLDAKDITFDVENETANISFEKEILEGTYILNLKFDGCLNDKMKGFYRSKYFTADGQERYAAVTQFEATDARRCFPCWDEPACKATFDIILIVPQNLVALSNMPVKHLDMLDNDLKKLTFARTPIMSTYLVAVVVGEFDYIEDTSSDGILVRVFTPVGKKNQGLFALEVATKVLPFYKQYFNVPYPLPKIDLIAISDFSAGAMENWGLITYRETYLLVDPANTSSIRKQSIALTVGHEIAHQWFGNLVTMEWWTHLWLNEGYASFVEFLCVDHLFPEYDIWTQFVTDMYTRALELDCLNHSHPIEVIVNHPSEIDEIFDEISYNKGASIIRMLHHYIGDSDFRKGMNIYLMKHQYKNTSTENLWRALEEASNKPVGSIMSTWVKQKGFPVVTVSSEFENNTQVLTLSQSKFMADGSKSNVEFWKIPITISTAKNPTMVSSTFILDEKMKKIIVDNVSEQDWIKVNSGTVGFYRTSYSSEMLLKLIPAITELKLPALDRLGLIDDLFAMVQAGHASTTDALRLLDAYRNETDYTVWSSITNLMCKLQVLLSHTDLREKFKQYGIKIYKPIAKLLGWNGEKNEAHLRSLLRSLVIDRLVSFKCPEIVDEAKKRLKAHINNEEFLSADLRCACYKAYLQDGDESTYEEMLNLYRSTDLHEEKDRISRALGCIQNVEILRKVIDFAMSDEVRAQDSVFVIIAVAMNAKGRDLCWNFFKENSDKLLQQYEGGFLLARLIKYLTENFASEEKALEVEKFFEENLFPGTERTVSQSVETIRLNYSWLQRDLNAIQSYLSNIS